MVSQWISGQIFYQGNKTTPKMHIHRVRNMASEWGNHFTSCWCRNKLCYSLGKYKVLKINVLMLFILKTSSPSRNWERKGIAKPLGITTCLLRNAPAWTMKSMMHLWAASFHPADKMIWSVITGQVFVDETAHQLTDEKKEPEQNK